jgi:lipoate-protein ligase B
LLVEHDPPVYTVGRQNTEEDFLLPIHTLEERGCQVVKTGRGGAGTLSLSLFPSPLLTLVVPAVTWHGPGQIVGYPILNLNRYTPSVHAPPFPALLCRLSPGLKAHSFGYQVRWYVHALEEVLVRTLAQFGLKSHTTSDVGVWIDGQRKIAAIGIAVSRWVTMHGSIPPLLSGLVERRKRS